MVRSRISTITAIVLLAVYCHAPAGGPTPNSNADQCKNSNCLVVAEDSVYCSIDPYVLSRGSIFASKSYLRIRSGIYRLTNKEYMSDLALRIQTRSGSAKLKPAATSRYSIRPVEEGDQGGMTERLEITAPYSGEQLVLERFLLRTTRKSGGPFLLDDPRDVRQFFGSDKHLLIRVAGESPLFPGLRDKTISYAPCVMNNLPDKPFLFEFADGSYLQLTVRFISGSYQIGYYVGRLLSASGNFGGMEINTNDFYRLAFIGSTRSWAEPAIPTLIVNFADKGKTCGVIFDSTQWDTEKAVNGYVAYTMTCDESRGEPLLLKHATYPQDFVFP